MMSRAQEHQLRIKALAQGIACPFCLSCGGPRERHGGTICRECLDVYNRAFLKRARRMIEDARRPATLRLVPGGRA